jgi:hypothetical protein
MAVATGFDFEPLPDGNVLIEFFGDDDLTCNKLRDAGRSDVGWEVEPEAWKGQIP